MKIDDKPKRGKAISILFGSFGQGDDAERMAIYTEMLADIPADVLDKVCKKAMYECKYLPSIAELLQSANNLMGEMAGSGVLSWDEAWKEIEKEMHNTFVYGKPKFSRPEIEKAVNAFGWQELCEVTIKELPIVRAQLRDMYNSVCENSKKSKINAYVLGTASLLDDGKTVRLMLK